MKIDFSALDWTTVIVSIVTSVAGYLFYLVYSLLKESNKLLQENITNARADIKRHDEEFAEMRKKNEADLAETRKKNDAEFAEMRKESAETRKLWASLLDKIYKIELEIKEIKLFQLTQQSKKN